MKLSAVQTDNAYAVTRGWVGPGIAQAFAELRNLTITQISPTTLSADTDDWNPTDLETASLIRVATDATRHLTGIVAPARSRLIIIANVGSFDLVLDDESGSSAAGNRFLCGGADLTVAPDQAAFLVYDLVSSRWRVVGGTGGATALDDLTDVDVPAPTDGQVLTWDDYAGLWVASPPTGGSSLYVNVKDYGATGDGTTDDTAAVNAAIAALNAAGSGVLYFPAGHYKVVSALTTITAPCLVLGDGKAGFDGATDYASRISCTSQTAALFTISAKSAKVAGLALVNTYAGTPNAGGGIVCSPSTGLERVDIEDVSVRGFYDCLDLQGTGWTVRNSWIYGPVRYGIRVRNTVIPDAGDWSVSDTGIFSAIQDATSAIRIESSGGGKITNVKTNMALDSKHFATGIDVAIATGITTSVLTISNCSLENMTGDAISIATAGTGKYGAVAISGVQVGLYLNNTGRAVKLTAAATGGMFTNGGIGNVVIDGCSFLTDGTARAAVSLTNTDLVTLGDISLYGFNARYTSSGDTNTTDGSAVSYATPTIALGSSAAGGAATTVIRSDATIAAFDTTAPSTQAFGDSAVVGTAAFAARRDHKHAMPASPALTAGVLLIADTHSTPIVFADVILNEATDDFLYSD